MFRHKLADIVTGVQEMFRDPEEEMAQERMATSVVDMQIRADALDKDIKSLMDKHINALSKKDYKIETLKASRSILMKQCSADANEKLKLKGMLDEARDELEIANEAREDAEGKVEELEKELHEMESQKNIALVDAEILRCQHRDKEKMLDRAFIDIQNYLEKNRELKKKLDKALLECEKWATGENY